MSNSNNSTRNTKLRTASNQVKNETRDDANTANRIGGLFLDMVDFDISDAGDVEISNPTADQGLIYSNGKWRNSAIPGGGGGGGGTTGSERMFFLNRVHNDTSPTKPSVDNYQNDTFVVGSDVWTPSNTNPPSGYDTWAIFVWFTDDTSPSTIDSPIRLYNSANSGGSNGADGEDVEFIYCTDDDMWDETTKSRMATALAEFTNGGARVTDPVNIGGQTWYNHPNGVSPTVRFEYSAVRHSVLGPDGKTRVWTVGFNGPYLWSAFGERGTDGDGVEYIYYASESGTAPSVGDWPPNWTEDENFQNPEYIRTGSAWTDEPADLNETPYGAGSKQWVSIRKKKLWGKTDTEPTWGAYSTPKLWSGIGNDGVVNGYLVSSYNSTMLVTTDSTGAIDSFSDSCGFEVFHNSIPVEYTSDPSQADTHYMLEVNTSGISRSDGEATTGISASVVGNGMVTVTLTNVSNMDGTNISIPVVVKLPDGTTRNVVITVTGIAASEGGYAIDLYTSAYVIRTDYYEQNVVPASLGIGVRIGKGSQPNVYPSGSDSDSSTAEYRGYTFKYYYNGDSENPTAVTGSIPVAKSKNSITVEMYKDGSYLESRTIPYVKDGEPGIGISAVNYTIGVFSTSVATKTTSSQSGDVTNVAGELHFVVNKTTGADTVEITTNPFTGTGGDNESIFVTINDNDVDPVYNDSTGEWVATLNSTAFDKDFPFSQIWVQSQTGVYLAAVSIPIIRDGKDGSSTVQGLDAVVMRFRSYAAITTGQGDGYGDIQKGTTPYTDGVIYKDIILFDGSTGDGDYYYVAPTNTDTCNQAWAQANPPATSGTTNEAWVRFNRMGDAAFQALLAKYAYIENLTAKEIVVTKDNKPVAGISSGTAVGSDGKQHSVIANGNYNTATTDKGNVRIWAGYSDETADLLKSKFYVTDEGYLHAGNAEIAGTFTSLDGTAKVFQEETSTFPKRGFSVQTENNGQTTAELFSSDWNTYDTGELFLKQVDANNNVVSNSLFYPFSWSINKGSGYGTGYNRVLISATGTQGEISLYSDEANSGSLNIKADGTISGNVSLPGNILTESSITLPSNPKTGMVIFAIFCNRVTSAKPIHLPSGTPIENYTQGFSFDYSAPLIFVYTGTFWQIFYCGT